MNDDFAYEMLVQRYRRENPGLMNYIHDFSVNENIRKLGPSSGIKLLGVIVMRLIESQAEADREAAAYSKSQ